MARYIDSNNGTPVINWKKKTSNIVLDGLNTNLVNYINTLEPEFRDKIIVTAGSERGPHKPNSRHYHGAALDLRMDDGLYNRIKQDPNRLKFGITLLDPNHGTAPHLHLSVGNGSENKKDVWVDPHSEEAKSYITPSSDHILPDNPDSTSTPQNGSSIIINQDTSQMDYYKSLLNEYFVKESELSEKLKEEKAFAEYQNGVQNAIKDRIQKQVDLMTMINSHELSPVSGRKRGVSSFATGGEFDGLNGNLQFKIDMIKSQMPNFKEIDYTQSETYKQLVNVQEQIKALLSNMPSSGNTQVTVNKSEPLPGSANQPPITDTTESHTDSNSKSINGINIDDLRKRFAAVENSGNLDFSSKHNNGPRSTAHGPYGWLNQGSHVQELWTNNVGGLKERYKTLSDFNNATWDNEEAKNVIEPLFIEWMLKKSGNNLDRMMAFNLAGYAGLKAYDRGDMGFRLGKNMSIGEYIRKSKELTS